MRLMSQANVWLYRRSDGKIGGTWRMGAAFRRGVPVLLLTTIGRKSGQRRTTPLLYLKDGPRYIVVASQGGMPRDPLWYLNVKQEPNVDVQVGAQHLPMRAHTASDVERAELWPQLVALYADFARYQSWTERVIPVVILELR
jgi:deazaflavin-dependent oxidoreductase (nitroreductase family)